MACSLGRKPQDRAPTTIEAPEGRWRLADLYFELGIFAVAPLGL